MICPTCQEAPDYERVPPSEVHAMTRLVAWGESFGADETKWREGFTGASGRELRKALRLAGLRVWSAWDREVRMPASQQEVAFTNAVLVHPDGNRFPGYATARECIETCQKDLYENDTHPWLALGGNAIEALSGLRLQPTFVRGSFLPVLHRPNKWFVGSIHPSFIVRGGGKSNPEGKQGKAQDSWAPLLAVDARRALSTMVPFVPAVRLSTPQEMLDAFQAETRLDPLPVLAVDIEGLAPNLSLLGLSWKHGESWVTQWNPDCVRILNVMFAQRNVCPVFHYGPFDIAEMATLGVTPPKKWVDTINTAALVNPEVKLGLESQVLTYVPGSITWKGLVDHNAGVEARTKTVALYEDLWTEVLTRLGRPIPQSRFEWYVFYNGQDVGDTRALALAHRKELEAQDRMTYYRLIMQPLQPVLLEMGQRGMWASLDRMAYHRRACERLERSAQRILDETYGTKLSGDVLDAESEVARLEAEREAELRVTKLRKFSQAEALTKARTRLRGLEGTSFNGDSHPQRKWVLYDLLKLPLVLDSDDGHILTDEDTVEFKISQLVRGTVKPPKASGITVPEAIRILRALIAIKRWAHWRRSFLTPKETGEEKDGLTRIRTAYNLHRTTTGRLSSGVDSTSDPEKGKKKRAQLQNVPLRLRDMFVAPPGYTLIGVDSSAIEWCIFMWYAATLLRSAFHQRLLDEFMAGRLDPHCYLASVFYGRPITKKDRAERQIAKPYTYGLLFMGGAAGVAAKSGHTGEIGQRMADAHRKAFNPQPLWRFFLKRVKERKYVETPLKWRRYFWHWDPKPTEVVATEIQGAAADLHKWLLKDIAQSLVAPRELLTVTHDSDVLMTKDEDVEEASQWLKAKLEQPVSFFEGQRFRAEMKTGKNWRQV